MKRHAVYSSSVYAKRLLFKNHKEADMEDEAAFMISTMPNSNTQNQLRRKFSRIETVEDAKRFQKYYTCVDEKLVDELVKAYMIKNNRTNS